MISTSAAFTAAETSDIAQVAGQVFILRGDYANANSWGATASASDTDASGYYPAAGAISGDHTEINIGPPSVADNGIGLVSWKGANTPSGGSPSTLTIAFNATRTFNYIKLYNLAANPLTAYTLQYYNGSTWVTFATYSAPYRTNGGLDIYDFSGAGTTYTGTQIRCVITGSTSGAANVVALECYYKQDVTSRCTSIKTNRQRDWKQINPMAAKCELEFDNSDQFFSPSYSPTGAQSSAGYFNSELDVGLKVIVQLGFWYCATSYLSLGYGTGGFGSGGYGTVVNTGAISNPEMISSFVGTIDAIKVSSKSGICTISARDGMKDVINQTWSTRLKGNIDIGACIQYCLNICNISNYEMNIATTGLTEPYFFAYEQSMLSVIQQLVQAAGVAQFWFDEYGIAQFKQLLNTTSSITDFVFNPIIPTQFTTVANNGSITAAANAIQVTSAIGSGAYSIASALSTITTGWQFTTTISSAVANGYVFFMATTQGGSGTLPNGYALYFNNAGYVYLVRATGGSLTYLTSYNYGYAANTTMNWTIYRTWYPQTSSWFYFIYLNGVLVFAPTTSDSTYTTSSYFNVVAYQCTLSVGNISYLNANYTQVVSVLTSFSPLIWSLTFTSEIIDQSVYLASEGNFSAGLSPANAPITYQTRTAWTSGGIPAASWNTVTLNTATQKGPIPSTVREFIQYQFYFSVGYTGSYNNGYVTGGSPLWSAYYVGLSWNISGAVSYRQFSYATQVCDITQQISDSLAGDSSILNYFEVISSPLSLGQTTGTVQWTAQSGFPAGNVSASNPLVVNTGITTIQAVIPSGMDTTYMAASITGTAGNSYGASGTTAFLVTFGTAAGTISISYIHPTKPIITLNITTAGTITNLQLIGQSFSGSNNPIDVITGDVYSQSRYKRRTTQISNNFIISPAIAQLIANNQLIVYRLPATLLSGLQLLLTPSVQLTDQFRVTDQLLALSSQVWNITGITHEITKDKTGAGATVKTDVTAIVLNSY